MKDTKASLEIAHKGNCYACELERDELGRLHVGLYENAFLTTTLPPGIALAFADWQRSVIPRLCGHTKLAKDLLLGDASALMLRAHETFR